MITRLLAIQKIEENGNITVFEITANHFQWAFESDRGLTDTDKVFFPFTVDSRGEIFQRKSGPETKTRLESETLSFYDDYGVPDGSVIAILPPKNFIPDIIKFKDNPHIPANLVGQIVSRPPGQIQILYNQLEKISTVIMHVQEKQLFGIKCLFKKVSDEEFPTTREYWSDELFDVSISRDLLNIKSIQTDDLKIFNDTMNVVDLSEMNSLLNEILEALKSNNKAKSQNSLLKFGNFLLKSTATIGNLNKAIEGVTDGGAVNTFVKQVLKYVNLP